MTIQHDIYGQLTRARVGRSLLALVLLCGWSDNTRNASGRREGGGSCRVFCEHSVPASSLRALEASPLGRKSSKTSPMDGGKKDHTMGFLQQRNHRGELGSNQPSSSGQMSNLATSRNQLLFSCFSPVHLWLQDEANWRVRELLLREFREGRDADIQAWAFGIWYYVTTGIAGTPEP